MSAHVLVTGTLFRSPERRTSKAGNPFVTATLRVKDGDETQWWKVVTFGETVQAELMRLNDGDAISAQGPLRIETYEKGGATKLSLTVVADRVLALRQPAKKREAKTDAPLPADGPNDAMPFGRRNEG